MRTTRVRPFATPWTIQSMEFSRPEYWSGWPFPSPEDLPNPGTEPRSPTLLEDSLPAEPPGKPKNTQISATGGPSPVEVATSPADRPQSVSPPGGRRQAWCGTAPSSAPPPTGYFRMRGAGYPQPPPARKRRTSGAGRGRGSEDAGAGPAPCAQAPLRPPLRGPRRGGTPA